MKMTKPHLFTTALATIAVLNGNFKTGYPVESETSSDAEAIQFTTEIDQPLLSSRNQGNSKVIIRIDLQGAPARRTTRHTPLNLAVVLDRSGSMSGPKLEQAKQAAHILIDQLDQGDVFSLVMYDTEVEVLIPAQKLGSQRRKFHQAVARIRSGGSTALYHGVETGGQQLKEYLTAKRLNRVILLSDGIANIGPSSNREIAHLGQRLAREDISVTTIGLGNDYNENLMTALAESSDANYYYVADVEELSNVFRRELGELKALVARNIVIKIECPQGVKPLRFLGRPEKLKAQHEEVEFKTLADEQIRHLFLECEIDASAKGTVSRIAEISLKCKNASDEVKNARQTVVIGYEEDESLVEKSRNRALTAEAAVYSNAIETEKAIALSDQGDVAACRAQLNQQALCLRKAWEEAPQKQKATLKQELDAIAGAQSDLESNERFSRSQRKRLQSEVFSLRNSKR